MPEIIQIDDSFYIRATSSLIDTRTQILMAGDTFAVFDRHGDILPLGQAQGLYHEGTRFISLFAITIGGEQPLLLNSSIRRDNRHLSVDLTNPDLRLGGEKQLVRNELVHLHRDKFVWEGGYCERIRISNYAPESIILPLEVQFGADFADIFEVRGTPRGRRGTLLPTKLEASQAIIDYQGTDGKIRRARLSFDPRPDEIGQGRAVWRFRLSTRETRSLHIHVYCTYNGGVGSNFVGDCQNALKTLLSADKAFRAAGADIRTDNERFNQWLERSWADLQMLIALTPYGHYPYSGVPWFATPFGRDGIITAMEVLWASPRVAKGVLSFLAAHQAESLDPAKDSEPGKILHEMRKGEMATTGEVPFAHYYGSVDAIPLFIILAGEYFKHTGDREFIQGLWPHIERALEWIDRYGDVDGDGFVEYHRRSDAGLLNQGWKDSHDSIFHSDGGLAEAPIALVEVQAYVYAAFLAAAELAENLGMVGKAGSLRKKSEELKEGIQRAFWCEELGTYGLALDGKKQLCRVRTSNGGHVLFAGASHDERAKQVVETLLDRKMYSGWGIRTVAVGEARYNPLSYHNGSVWPHDNALIAWGLARYGFKDEVMHIFEGIYQAANWFELRRLPELFCGFHRRPGDGPTHYPVACSPQAWAAGAVFLLLKAALGLNADAKNARVHFLRPVLPGFLNEVEIRKLRVGEASVDLMLRGHDEDVTVQVVRREGQAEVIVTK